MKALQNYLDEINGWEAIFGTAPLAMPTNAINAQPIIDRLESDLSPENLHCDGELSVAAVRNKYSDLMQVQRDLSKIVGRQLDLG